MLCGFPCSGKSTAVAKLAAHLRSKTKFAVRCLCAYILKFYHFYGLFVVSMSIYYLFTSPRPCFGLAVPNDMQVEIVSDSSLGLTYGQFDSAGTEKIARGAVKAATERMVDVGTVVIVDSLNYIKGYRYELYCIAKSLQTPSCVLHMATSDKVAAEWNAARYKQTVSIFLFLFFPRSLHIPFHFHEFPSIVQYLRLHACVPACPCLCVLVCVLLLLAGLTTVACYFSLIFLKHIILSGRQVKADMMMVLWLMVEL